MISENTDIPMREEGGPTIVKAAAFASTMSPASLFSHLKNFSVQVKAWTVKNGEGMKFLSHRSSWKAHLITSKEHTALRLGVTGIDGTEESVEEGNEGKGGDGG